MSLPHPNSQLHDPSQPPPALGTTPVNDLAPPKDQRVPEMHGQNAFNSDRPLGVAPAPEGGVAIGGQPDLPEGRANVVDKVVGKTQKVIGKYTNNPELHEKGELRETGGKAAAEGRARAAHD